MSYSTPDELNPNNIQRRSEWMMKSFGYVSGNIEKGGIGSGRWHIGTTTSGKKVWDKFNHPDHKDFTSQDHNEAARFNQKLANGGRRSSKHQAASMTADKKISDHKDSERAHIDKEIEKVEKKHKEMKKSEDINELAKAITVDNAFGDIMKGGFGIYKD